MELSLDQPIRLTLSALMDGKPLSLEGQVGPSDRIQAREKSLSMSQ